MLLVRWPPKIRTRNSELSENSKLVWWDQHDLKLLTAALALTHPNPAALVTSCHAICFEYFIEHQVGFECSVNFT